MTDRKQAKPFEQDVLGILFCALGGFVAVSIVLSWMGQEPKGDLWSQPIQALIAALGPFAALLFSLGLSVLGTMMFLRSTSTASLRLLLGLSAAAIGLALLAGTIGRGGALGDVFPGLFPGGPVVAGLLGLAVIWLGLVLASPGVRRPGGAPAVQRVGLTTRSESSAASVSAAEAALLTPEAPRGRSGSVGVVTPLPRSTGPASAPAARPVAPRTKREDDGVRPLIQEPSVRPLGEAASAAAGELEATAAEAPPTPSWEQEETSDPFSEAISSPEEALHDELQEAAVADEEEFEELADELADELDELEEEDAEEAEEEDQELVGEDDSEEQAELEAEDDEEEEEEEGEDDELEAVSEYEEEEEELEEEELEDEPELVAELDEEPDEEPELQAVSEEQPEPAVPAASGTAEGGPVRASWEQIGLFDEEEPLTPTRATASESTEPAAPGAAGEANDESRFTLEPTPPPEPAEQPSEPAGARDWAQLVHEAGRLVLEENRVAVSMLQRRFGIEFDEACRVLDELQETGLIGPYMGGRTRDILLTRDEWLAQTPRVS
jgi:hypothetical protein